MMQANFNQRGCKPFFKKHRQQATAIKDVIAKGLVREVAAGMPNVKLASRQRIGGQRVYEMRLNIGKPGSVRLAFAVDGDQVTVFFISAHLQKATFSQEFDHVLVSLRTD